MPLFEEGVFSVLCLLTAISIRILKTITKVIENTKEPAHFRILNLTPHIYGSAMQPVSEPFDLSLRSEEHTSELQSPCNLVCRLLLEKKKKNTQISYPIRHTELNTAQAVT